ncbi:MAG: DUF2975 domain-containing protein [Sporolactobacillus sp.]|jgi:hypothetical protein|nr:DUF2975 domain-containing protein [Sporolactobacillus sp.]MCI1882000.1 DUF2975 domain-containing protein [Sporolactobacillus sp.]
MKQAQLAKWLKIMTVIVGIIGLFIAFLYLPLIGHDYVIDDPSLKFLFWPYLIWAWVSIAPCFATLCYFWKICGEIANDHSFCRANVSRLKKISRLFLFDTCLFFLVSVLFTILEMTNAAVLIVTFFIDVGGISLAMIFAVLSHLVDKAVKLKETNDLTI